MQSPIDIGSDSLDYTNIAPPSIAYRESEFYPENTGWTLLNFTDAESFINWNKCKYRLVQFHLHTSAEHTFNGLRFPLTAHFVHSNTGGDLLVIASLFDTGETNHILTPALEAFKEGKSFILNPSNLLDTRRGYFVYSGSLTTEPHTEGVTWIILNQLQKVSQQQVEEYYSIFGKETVRDIQNLNGVSVKFFGEISEGVDTITGYLTPD